jgi:hypothetical protein
MVRFAVVALTTCTIALGQQAPAAQTLDGNVNFRAAAEKTFLQYEASMATQCGEIAPDWGRAQQTIYVAPVIDAQKRLVSGIWSEMVPGKACGVPRNFRALVVIRNGQIDLARQLPGTSNTTPLLEKDVRLAIMNALRAKHPNDDLPAGFDVLDTETIGANPPASHQNWNEVWTARIKGHDMRIAIEFIPDAVGDGTTFKVNARTVGYLSEAKP